MNMKNHEWTNSLQYKAWYHCHDRAETGSAYGQADQRRCQRYSDQFSKSSTWDQSPFDGWTGGAGKGNYQRIAIPDHMCHK